jgi:hypothetical protein
VFFQEACSDNVACRETHALTWSSWSLLILPLTYHMMLRETEIMMIEACRETEHHYLGPRELA